MKAIYLFIILIRQSDGAEETYTLASVAVSFKGSFTYKITMRHFSCGADILFIITMMTDGRLLNLDVRHLLKQGISVFSQHSGKKVQIAIVDQLLAMCCFNEEPCEVSHLTRCRCVFVIFCCLRRAQDFDRTHTGEKRISKRPVCKTYAKSCARDICSRAWLYIHVFHRYVIISHYASASERMAPSLQLRLLEKK